MSSINPNNIDGTFPIAGQDNDSQGFRDNFTNVKNNLTFAKSEIEDLQKNVLLKGALSGTTLNNDLSNAQLKGVQSLRFTETIKDLGTLDGTVTLSWQDAHFQVLTTSGSVTLAFTGWPTSGFYTKLRLELHVTTPATDTLTLPAAVSEGLDQIQGALEQVITFPTQGTYTFEFTTYDGGTTIAIEDVSRNYAPGYQYNAPANNFDITINTNTNRLILSPSTNNILANGTITLPAGNVDARTVSIHSTYGITALQVLPSSGTTLKPSANITLANGSSASYFYHSSESSWYKIG